MNRLIESPTLAQSQIRHAELTRLGFRPFSIFQTPQGWAFWTAQ